MKKLKIREVKKLNQIIRGKARIQILVSLTPKPEFLTHTVPKIKKIIDVLGSSQHILIKTNQINFIPLLTDQMPCNLHRFHHDRVTYKPS